MGALESIDQFIGDIDRCKDVEDVFEVLRLKTESMGFSMYTYWLMISPNEAAKTNPLWVSSYPVQWSEYYLAHDFGKDDLVVRNSALTNTPFLWSDLDQKFRMTDNQKLVLREGREAGIKAGGTIPIHGPGKAIATFSVANDNDEHEFEKLFKSCKHELQLMLTYAHERLMTFEIGKVFQDGTDLNAREIECLTWAAAGKTRWETGQILSLSERTIKKYLESAMLKLGVCNTTHSVAKATILGIIQP